MAMVIFITTNNKSPNFFCIYQKTNNYPNGATLADN